MTIAERISIREQAEHERAVRHAESKKRRDDAIDQWLHSVDEVLGEEPATIHQ